MVKNCAGKIRLGNGKWAFPQAPGFREEAERFLPEIKKRWEPNRYFHHMHRGGHIRALRLHQSNSYFARIDLKDFFSHVTKSKIMRSLCGLGLGHAMANNIARDSTIFVPNYERRLALPFGFIQSPLLATLCLDASCLGSAIKEIRQSDVKVSVYMDDIILSGDDGSAVSDAYAVLRDAAAKANFLINEEKSHDTREQTTAFNIKMSKCSLLVDDERYQAFYEAALHSTNRNRIDGIVYYVRTVSSKQAESLDKLLEGPLALQNQPVP